jgi:hypothetical protein
MSYPDPNKAHMNASAEASAIERVWSDHHAMQRRAKALELAVLRKNSRTAPPDSVPELADMYLRYIEMGAWPE